ncbi:hypothetical protein QE152_g33799 [Popillia japonica]|uniref:Integrase catalytic domain-containing protein n=1 Tax=Popillia japonica TaxID=7064 RepID=A0AAW1IVN2_POPJA
MHWTTPVYHPRANPVERRNQEIKKGLRIHLANEDNARWDETLDAVLFNIRSRRNAATGFSPSMALFGRELRRPGDWREPRREEAVARALVTGENHEERRL